MKELSIETLSNLTGSGCGKWVRRYNRAHKKGADWQTLKAINDSLDDCIMKKYYS